MYCAFQATYMSSTISGLVRKTELEAMRKCLRQEIQVDRMSRKEGLSDHSISGLYIQSNAIHLRDRKSQRRQNKKKSPKKQKKKKPTLLKHQSQASIICSTIDRQNGGPRTSSPSTRSRPTSHRLQHQRLRPAIRIPKESLLLPNLHHLLAHRSVTENLVPGSLLLFLGL